MWHWKKFKRLPQPLTPLLLFLHSCLPFLHIFFLKKKKTSQRKGKATCKIEVVRLRNSLKWLGSIFFMYFFSDIFFSFFSYFGAILNLLLCTNRSSKDVAQWKPVARLLSVPQSLLSHPDHVPAENWPCCVYTIDSKRSILGIVKNRCLLVKLPFK